MFADPVMPWLALPLICLVAVVGTILIMAFQKDRGDALYIIGLMMLASPIFGGLLAVPIYQIAGLPFGIAIDRMLTGTSALHVGLTLGVSMTLTLLGYVASHSTHPSR